MKNLKNTGEGKIAYWFYWFEHKNQAIGGVNEK